MKELLIGIIEIIGGSFEVIASGRNTKKSILIILGLFLIVIAIVYYLTKDFNTVNTISR